MDEMEDVRSAPQSLEAERAVLGSILLSNNSLMDVVSILKDVDFHRPTHGLIYRAMQSLANKSEPIDIITVGEEVRRGGGRVDDLDAYLASLDSAVPATANIERYASIVREKALRRRLIEAGADIIRRAGEGGDIATQVAAAEEAVFAVADLGSNRAVKTIADAIKRVFSQIEARYEQQNDVTGLATGFEDFDRVTAGMHPSDLIIIAGRPGAGKSAWAMNVALHVAVEQKLPVAVFNMEMSEDSIIERAFSSEGMIDGSTIRTGKVGERDWPKLAKACDRLYKAPLIVDDTPGLTCMELRARCRRIRAKHPKLALVVVDYLQLLRGANRTIREQEVAEISRSLKILAMEMRLPVLALAQLNRGIEKREDKRPMMSDLRESGGIENDADLVGFVHRPEMYDPEKDKGMAELVIVKQRKGNTGTVRFEFAKQYTKFMPVKERSTWG